MEVTIRKANEHDCPAIMDLVRELALYERAPHEVTVTMDHFMDSGFGPNPVWWALVAEVPNETGSPVIVGMALWYIRYSTWKGQRMYLEDIVVKEAYRGNGIGHLLMDAIIEEAKRHDFSGIMWQVLDWNEPAINFYKRYDVRFDDEWVNCSIEVV